MRPTLNHTFIWNHPNYAFRKAILMRDCSEKCRGKCRNYYYELCCCLVVRCSRMGNYFEIFRSMSFWDFSFYVSSSTLLPSYFYITLYLADWNLLLFKIMKIVKVAETLVYIVIDTLLNSFKSRFIRYEFVYFWILDNIILL